MTRSELEDERTFLLRSIEDLDREHEAGDLSDEDHAALRDGYIARTAEVLRSLQEPTPGAGRHTDVTGGNRRHRHPTAGHRSPPAAPVRRRRRLFIGAGAAVLIGCVVLSVVAHVGPRLPGESLTGSVTLTASQQTARTLAQAETLESQGNAAGAVTLYGSVLRQDPDQEQALAEVGWLEYEAGAQARQANLLSLGEEEERRAENLDPADFAPHLYLGSMLLAQGDAPGAVAQYRTFLADHPTRAKVTAAVPFITEAFSEAHLPPPSLPVGRPAKP